MSTELIKIDDEQFGKLIEMPELYKKNLAIIEKAKPYIQLQFECYDKVIATTDVLDNGWIKPIQDLRALCATRKKEFEAERKPHTQKMDAIKSLFTALEKVFADGEEGCKKRESEFERKKVEYNAAREVKIEAAPLETVFDVAAAFPVAIAAKGLTTKQKYAPTTHAHLVSIMRSFVSKDLQLYTF